MIGFSRNNRLSVVILNPPALAGGRLISWLVEKSEIVQIELGVSGLADWKPAFANYIHHNYPLILNLISYGSNSSKLASLHG
jgi:hypothetical protein